MFFRIEAAVRGGYTNPACTSKVCTWNIPAQKTIVQPVRAKEMNFTASKFNKGMETRLKKKYHFYAVYFLSLLAFIAAILLWMMIIPLISILSLHTTPHEAFLMAILFSFSSAIKTCCVCKPKVVYTIERKGQ